MSSYLKNKLQILRMLSSKTAPEIKQAVEVTQATPSGGYVSHGLATAANDFLVASGVGVFVKKTLAQVKVILGLGTAAYTAATAYVTHALATAANDFLVASGSGVFVKKTLAETKTILGVTAGVTDHGDLAGLTDDDHQQYQLESLLPTVAISLLSTTPNIDAKVVATTDLYTAPAGKSAVITSTIVRVTTANNITVVPTLGIGVAAGEDDIIGSGDTTGLDAITKMWRSDVEGTARIIAPGETVKLGIDGGATATAMIISVDLVGYLV
jgi:hypothetical protein